VVIAPTTMRKVIVSPVEATITTTRSGGLDAVQDDTGGEVGLQLRLELPGVETARCEVLGAYPLQPLHLPSGARDSACFGAARPHVATPFTRSAAMINPRSGTPK
jgi:hypothetical protein